MTSILVFMDTAIFLHISAELLNFGSRDFTTGLVSRDRFDVLTQIISVATQRGGPDYLSCALVKPTIQPIFQGHLVVLTQVSSSAFPSEDISSFSN